MGTAVAPREQSAASGVERGLWKARFAFLCFLVVVAAAIWLSLKRPDADPRSAGAVATPRPAEQRVLNRVVLGSPSLFAGIPGDAKLTIPQIKRWLDDPANHEPLDFELPLWLRDTPEAASLVLDEPLTRAKIELGRQLFLEQRYVRGDFACVKCHHPDQGFSRPTFFTHHKNPPAMFNRLLSTKQFWDGRADSLEHQVEFPVLSGQEMNSTKEKCEQVIRDTEGYRIQFERIYGEATFTNFTKAIAAFERALMTGPGAYDYDRVKRELEARDPNSLTAREAASLKEAREGAMKHPLSASAMRGRELFFSDRANCAQCHTGPNFTDERFHNLGIGAGESHLHELGTHSVPDDGRFHVTGDDADYATFKTPTLRNLLSTGAFFHDASAGTLDIAVRYIASGGKPNKNLSPLIHPLDLTDAEISDLVAFLESLQGDLPKIRMDGLPE